MIKKLTEDQLNFMYQEHRDYEIKCCGADDMTKFQFLCNEVFNLFPYDSDIEDSWGRDLFRVLNHINRGIGSDYWSASDENYNKYLIICQLLDMKHWINWGTSIRSAWFEFSDNSDRLFEFITCVSVDDKEHYDEEGVEWNQENLNTLLTWCSKE